MKVKRGTKLIHKVDHKIYTVRSVYVNATLNKNIVKIGQYRSGYVSHWYVSSLNEFFYPYTKATRILFAGAKL